MRSLTLIFLFLMTGAASLSSAQTSATVTIGYEQAANELNLINKENGVMNNYSVDVTHKFYQNHIALAAVQVYNGFYRRSGTSFHSNLLGIECLQDQVRRVTIDSADGILLVSKPGELAVSNFSMENCLSLLKSCKNIQKITSDAETVYRLNFSVSESEFLRIEVSFNSQKRMSRLVFYHNQEINIDDNMQSGRKEKPKTEIVFTNYQLKSRISSAEFSTSRYVENNKGSLRPTAPYKNYQLINE